MIGCQLSNQFEKIGGCKADLELRKRTFSSQFSCHLQQFKDNSKMSTPADDEGYEEMGGPAANPAIPAFPVSSSGASAKPSPAGNTGGIPQFPVAGASGSAAPASKASKMENGAGAFVDQSKMDGKSKMKGGKGGGASRMSDDGKKKNKKKNKKKSENSENENGSRMESASLAPATHRPNSVDTCQLAMVIFFVVLIIAISTPVLLTATGNAEIEYIKKGLTTL
ncbi:unnamed protein product [Caenorhabditis nigoni]